ncbi:unnamed protein product, partial [Ilex paraguariensis]
LGNQVKPSKDGKNGSREIPESVRFTINKPQKIYVDQPAVNCDLNVNEQSNGEVTLFNVTFSFEQGVHTGRDSALNVNVQSNGKDSLVNIPANFEQGDHSGKDDVNPYKQIEDELVTNQVDNETHVHTPVKVQDSRSFTILNKQFSDVVDSTFFLDHN